MAQIAPLNALLNTPPNTAYTQHIINRIKHQPVSLRNTSKYIFINPQMALRRFLGKRNYNPSVILMNIIKTCST